MSIESLKKAKVKAENKGNLKEASTLCQYIGSELEKRGNYNEALEMYQEALRNCEILEDNLDIAVSHRLIGACFYYLLDYTNAIFHVKLYLEKATILDSQIEIQRARCTLGKLYLDIFTAEDNKSLREQKLLDKAKTNFLKALEITSKLKDSLSPKDHGEMRAKLLLNIGLIYEEYKDIKRCGEHIMEAIVLAKKFKLFEDLHRCQHSLGAVYFRIKDYEHALINMDEAIHTARLLNDEEELFDSLYVKSQILFRSGKIEVAKSIMKQARKLNVVNSLFDKDFRIVTYLCRSKVQLGQVPEDDLKTRIDIYEKLGDGFVALDCYDQAIDSYLKVLELAKSITLSDQKLASIYYSIGHTYWDMKLYNKALEYLSLELKLHKNNHVEKFKTIMNMIEILSETKKATHILKELLYQAYVLAKEIDNDKMNLCLRRIKKYLSKEDITEDIQTEIAKLPPLPDHEGEEECSEDEDPFKDVQLSSASEDEGAGGKNSHSRRRKRMVISTKKNDVGETPLHNSCKEGNLKITKHLIENNHPVNPRDNCGWLPLHEAANFGHYDVVEYLLDNGAWINDQDGKLCDRISPLHDAAQAGHVDVMRLLLERGADPNALTLQGNTPLDCLRFWREENSSEESSSVDQQDLDIAKAFEKELEKVTVKTSKKTTVDFTRREPKPRREDSYHLLESDLYENHKWKSQISGKSNAVNEYENTMQNLRRPNQSNSKYEVSLSSKKKMSALIPETSLVTDDWLIEDVAKPPPKRPHKDYFSTGSTSKRQKTLKDYHNTQEIEDDFQNDDLDAYFENMQYDDDFDSTTETPFQDNVSERTSSNLYKEDSRISPHLMAPSSRFCLRINIKEKTILVPVSSPALTIRWLAGQAADRYFELSDIRPVLCLRKLDGALLSPSDIIETVLVHNEVLIGDIESWILPPAPQRYQEACSKHGVGSCQDLVDKFQSLAVTPQLHLRLFSPSQAKPVFQALQLQASLRDLTLEGSKMNEEGIELLAACLGTLPNLNSLNLSTCNLSNRCVSILAAKVTEPLPSLERFNLSFNPLGNEISESLSAFLINGPNIKSLSLSGCGLDHSLFENQKFADSFKNLPLQEFSFSNNRLTGKGLEVVLRLLPLENLTQLNLSNSVQKGSRLGETLSQHVDHKSLGGLKSLLLKGCHLQAQDIVFLKQVLRSCSSLQELDLSANPGLAWATIEEFFNDHPFCSFNLASSVMWTGETIPNNLNITFTGFCHGHLENSLPLTLGPGGLFKTMPF